MKVSGGVPLFCCERFWREPGCGGQARRWRRFYIWPKTGGAPWPASSHRKARPQKIGVSGLERSDVSDDRQNVVIAELLDDGLHQLRARADASEMLEIIELAREIARRASGQ